MIIIILQIIFFLFLAYKIRTNLSLGNGFAVSMAFVLIMIICSILFKPNILFLLFSFIPYIPIVNKIFFRMPILSKILLEIGILLKILIRLGISRKKIQEAIHKTHGVDFSTIDKK